MKKRLLLGIGIGLALLTLASCGKEKDDKKDITSTDIITSTETSTSKSTSISTSKSTSTSTSKSTSTSTSKSTSTSTSKSTSTSTSKSTSTSTSKSTPVVELSFSISKDLFEFAYGVSVDDIEAEIKKYVTTNGTISFSTISTTVAHQTIYVSASLGNKSMGQTVTVNIKEAELSLSISKTTFDFIYGVSPSDVATEIKKYVTTNGEISIVDIKISLGTHEVSVFATRGNDSKFVKVTVNIIEGASINLSKTSFEFNNGTTLDEMKEEITKCITTNGTISFTGLETQPGTYNCKVFAVKNNSSVYKDFTVTVLDTLIFKLTQEKLDFLYGTTWGDIKSAVNNCIVTNGSYSYTDEISSSTVLSCGEYYMNITATYKGQTETKKLYINVNPDSSKIKLAPFSTYPCNMSVTSSSMSYSLAFTNNSGKQIKSMDIYVYMYVNGVVRTFSYFVYDETKTWTYKNGETTSVRYTQTYSSNFASFNFSDDAGEHYTGYDYNFWKSYTSTYTVHVYFRNVEYY